MGTVDLHHHDKDYLEEIKLFCQTLSKVHINLKDSDNIKLLH